MARSPRAYPLKRACAYIIRVFVCLYNDEYLDIYVLSLDLRCPVHRDDTAAVSRAVIALGAVLSVGGDTYYKRDRTT